MKKIYFLLQFFLIVSIDTYRISNQPGQTVEHCTADTVVLIFFSNVNPSKTMRKICKRQSMAWLILVRSSRYFVGNRIDVELQGEILTYIPLSFLHILSFKEILFRCNIHVLILITSSKYVWVTFMIPK